MVTGAATLGLAGLATPSVLLAQNPTAPGVWPVKALSPVQTELKNAVIVLRDTLRRLDATAVRLERASATNSVAVIKSSGRVLVDDCTRAARGAARMQEQVKSYSTSDKRGDAVLQRFRASVLMLNHAMTACSRDAAAALAPPARTTQLDSVRKVAVAAAAAYDRAVHELMRTLSIPLDPKGHKSAVEL